MWHNCLHRLSNTHCERHVDRPCLLWVLLFHIVISDLSAPLRGSTSAGVGRIWRCCRAVPPLLNLSLRLAVHGSTDTMDHHLDSSWTRTSHLPPSQLIFTFRRKQKMSSFNGCCLLLTHQTGFKQRQSIINTRSLYAAPVVLNGIYTSCLLTGQSHVSHGDS